MRVNTMEALFIKLPAEEATLSLRRRRLYSNTNKIILISIEESPRASSGLIYLAYSKNPHKRTGVLEVQAAFVLIHRVFSAKSA